MQVYKMEKNKLVFSALIIYFLIFTFFTPLGHLLLLDYTIHLWYFLKVSSAIFTKNISFTNGIFDMLTFLAIPFTILKTQNLLT